MPHLKDTSLLFFTFTFTPSKKLIFAKNFWQCLEQNEIQVVGQKMPFFKIYFLKNEQSSDLAVHFILKDIFQGLYGFF